MQPQLTKSFLLSFHVCGLLIRKSGALLLQTLAVKWISLAWPENSQEVLRNAQIHFLIHTQLLDTSEVLIKKCDAAISDTGQKLNNSRGLFFKMLNTRWRPDAELLSHPAHAVTPHPTSGAPYVPEHPPCHLSHWQVAYGYWLGSFLIRKPSHQVTYCK